jgi:SAM-dependent methyltransferase
MDWVEEFYRLQDKWAGVYSGEVSEHHREKAATIPCRSGLTSGRVLELGAGGGQMAAATADLGYVVTAVELVEHTADHARTLASKISKGSLNVIQGDFYKVELDGNFEVVTYWDGFGIGTDDDQHVLLRRIADWLTPNGCALIDINTPWYWGVTALGQHMTFGGVARRYDFDANGCRMLDSWWHIGAPDQTVTQSLRCYSPADLRLLLRDTGLKLIDCEPGGAVNYDTKEYTAHAPLAQAMSFTAKLVKVAQR